MMAGQLEHLQPWMKWLGLRRDLLVHIEKLQSPQREAITLRYGLGGERPMTMAETATRLSAKPVGAVRLVQRAVRELRKFARG